MLLARKKKKVHPYLSRARAFWRVAAKKRREGDNKSADWYAYQAQLAHSKWFQMQRNDK